VFLSIKGIGKKKSQLLLSKYKDIEVIADLSTKKLAKELSVSVNTAEGIVSIAKEVSS
jgi:excinuclease UvrABC nuclease subunit